MIYKEIQILRLSNIMTKYKILLIFLLCCFIHCQKKSKSNDTTVTRNIPTHKYKISWNSNTEPDISHYLIYAWHGSDTTASPFRDSSSAGRYSKYFIKKVNHRPQVATQKDTIEYVANGDWLQFAIAAVNNSGGASSISVSDFMKSEVPDSLSQK